MNYSRKIIGFTALGMLCILSDRALAQSANAYRVFEPSETFDLKFSLLNRFDFLEGQFRKANTGTSDQLFTSRFIVDGEYRNDSFQLNFEIADTRQALADDGSPVNSRTNGALDLQQLYATWRWEDAFANGDDVQLQVGRQTVNLEARRLVARSISIEPTSFTGVALDYERANGDQLKAFSYAPVLRFPNNRADIIDNKIEWNEESKGARFSGLFATLPNLLPNLSSQLYVFHLDEQDDGEEQYADLEIVTFGARVFKSAAVNQFDFDLQTAWQTGESRASSNPLDTRDLDHQAAFYHLDVGYTFDMPLRTRMQLLLDYATGDDDPADNENNRFDALFGARRAGFGQTSIYGPIWRTNLSSIGARATINFTPQLNLVVTLRDYDLASSKDSWGSTGWRDATGQSGVELGQHLETRLRWSAIPGNLMVDTGLMWLDSGEFAEKVSLGTASSVSRFFYLQTLLSF